MRFGDNQYANSVITDKLVYIMPFIVEVVGGCASKPFDVQGSNLEGRVGVA
jgi:hypothetical protein